MTNTLAYYSSIIKLFSGFNGWIKPSFKRKTWSEIFDSDKHASLLHVGINWHTKKFYSYGAKFTTLNFL